MARTFTTLAAAVLSASLAGCVTGAGGGIPTRGPVLFDIAPEPFNSQGQGMLRSGGAWVDTVSDAEARSRCDGKFACSRPNSFMA